MAEETVKNSAIEEKPSKSRRGCVISLIIIFVVLILCSISWILVRPGVFTIQPIGAIPNGVTFIYHSRNPEMPFFSSPDSLCMEMQGSVSLLCRGVALGVVEELADRIVLRLPYQRWAYLRSTGGLEFDQ
jgi:hypothetical protein